MPNLVVIYVPLLEHPQFPESAKKSGVRISKAEVSLRPYPSSHSFCELFYKAWADGRQHRTPDFLALSIASRKKPRLSTGDWTGIPGIIQYRRISLPDPQVFTGLFKSWIAWERSLRFKYRATIGDRP